MKIFRYKLYVTGMFPEMKYGYKIQCWSWRKFKFVDYINGLSRTKICDKRLSEIINVHYSGPYLIFMVKR